ncbi:D-2-hydroxyacid dehydrogenase [Halobacillus massiliensis]|uniref:D-2-hydroxyacid dehydrogenase n=1 Tax=Halobacillus massiliensis TaxID=1926286 RepID=UPI0009E60C18|nr:D-2-hydroxyacid dehydrogenase [Halobacillus massiliensis]
MYILSAIKRVPEDIKERLRKNFESVDFNFCHGIKEAEQHLEKADVFLTYGEDLNNERIEKAANLRWIMVLSAGMDRMPFKKIEERNILVTNVRGIHAKPMAEYAISMLLQVSRNAKKLWEREHNHKWDRRVPMTEINGKTLVCLGTGAIAQETARLAQSFRMNTIGVSRSGSDQPYFEKVFKVEDMDDALKSADYCVAVLPSTLETQFMMEKDHFHKMPEHAVFLNMGRGDLVKTEVVLEAVREEKIAHAVLDVFEQEPLPEDHPFWDEERITVTPHISGISPQYLPRAFEVFERNLKAYFSNESLENVIDPKRGY